MRPRASVGSARAWQNPLRHGSGLADLPSHAEAPPRLALHLRQLTMYSHRMLTIASRLDVMNRLGRALADPTRSRILLRLLAAPGYPARLAEELDLTRTNVSNHLACLRGCGIVVAVPEGRSTRYEIADPHLTRALDALVDVVLAVDDGAECTDEDCDVPLCCGAGA